MDKEFNHQLLATHAFGLADSSVLEFLPPDVPATPVVPEAMPASAHLMPVIVDIGRLQADANAALLTMLYEADVQGEAPILPLLFQTDAPLADVVRYWNRTQLVTQSGGRTVWLRLHDPRVLHQLLRILSPAQRHKLLGPLDAIAYWVGDAWLTVRKDDLAQVALETGGSTAPWPWPRVENIGIINRALQSAGVNGSDVLHAKGALVEELIAIAVGKFGLTEQADQVEFASRGLSFSPTFYEHPEVSAAMRRSDDPEDDSRLADRLALISEDTWAALALPL